MKNIIWMLIMIMAMAAAGGCAVGSEEGQEGGKDQNSTESALDVSEESNGENAGGVERIMIAQNDETAEHMELVCDYADREFHIYIVHLKTLEEFGSRNEGDVTLYEDENILEFVLIKNTGSVTGAIDGPRVAVKMDLDTNEILEKEFEPAPDYPNPEQAEFSGEVLEIPDERLVEIGLYFKDIFDAYL